MSEITYNDHGKSYTLPLGHRNWKRVAGDIILIKEAEVNLPLTLQMQIKPDGSVVLARTCWNDGGNAYWHYSQGNSKYIDGKDVVQPLTAAQELTIAKLWADKVDGLEIDPLLPPEQLGWIGGTTQKLLSKTVLEILTDHNIKAPPVA